MAAVGVRQTSRKPGVGEDRKGVSWFLLLPVVVVEVAVGLVGDRGELQQLQQCGSGRGQRVVPSPARCGVQTRAPGDR